MEEGEAAVEKGAGHVIVRISTDSFSVCSGTYRRCLLIGVCDCFERLTRQ